MSNFVTLKNEARISRPVLEWGEGKVLAALRADRPAVLALHDHCLNPAHRLSQDQEKTLIKLGLLGSDGNPKPTIGSILECGMTGTGNDRQFASPILEK